MVPVERRSIRASEAAPRWARKRVKGQKMRKHKLLLLAAMFGVVGVATGGSPVSAQNEQVCQPQDAHVAPPNGTTKSITLTAPAGKVIVEVCVKAGSTQQGNGPEVTTFDPGVKSYTIKHSSDKDISHYTVKYGDAPEGDLPVIPAKPSLKGPTCDAAGFVEVLPDTETHSYSYDTIADVVTVSVTSKPGHVLSKYDGPWKFTVAPALSGDACVQAPPTEQSAGPLPPAQVPVPASAAAPAAETAAPAAAPPAPTALPATGSTSWALALSALAMLAGGLGLRRLSRRTDDSII
jgi:LPXTG-motif cell wall-anchored protein